MIEEYEEPARDKGIKIDSFIASNLPAVVRLDSQRFREDVGRVVGTFSLFMNTR